MTALELIDSIFARPAWGGVNVPGVGSKENGMAECPIGFTADDKKRLDNMYIDLYEGKNRNNPSVTARLLVLETDRNIVNSVRIALFGDEDTDGLIVKFERTIGLVRGGLWAFAIAGTVFLALFGWALGQVVPAAKIILDEYYHDHPAAKQSLRAPQTLSNLTQDAKKW